MVPRSSPASALPAEPATDFAVPYQPKVVAMRFLPPCSATRASPTVQVVQNRWFLNEFSVDKSGDLGWIRHNPAIWLDFALDFRSPRSVST